MNSSLAPGRSGPPEFFFSTGTAREGRGRGHLRIHADCGRPSGLAAIRPRQSAHGPISTRLESSILRGGSGSSRRECCPGCCRKSGADQGPGRRHFAREHSSSHHNFRAHRAGLHFPRRNRARGRSRCWHTRGCHHAAGAGRGHCCGAARGRVGRKRGRLLSCPGVHSPTLLPSPSRAAPGLPTALTALSLTLPPSHTPRRLLPQTAIASQASDRHSPFTGVAQWSPGRRRELWRRLLATQPAAEYSSLDA